MIDGPLVTAVMVTGLHEARYPLARIAIECFRCQTYRNRELLIINHGACSLQAEDPHIRELRVSKRPTDTIGDLRNIGLEEARGDAIICWDDDDWYSPRRIAIQMEPFIRHSGECAVVLRNAIRYNIVDRCGRYLRRPKGMPGSILHSARTGMRYQSLLRSSDQFFLDAFQTSLEVENEPSVYVRMFHGLNLWDGDHIMKGMVGSKYSGALHLTPEDQEVIARLLARYSSTYDQYRVQGGR